MQIIKKYWWIILLVVVFLFKDRIFKRTIKRGDKGDNVKKYQTILQQLLQMSSNTSMFNDENAVTELYRFMDRLEELSIANDWKGSFMNLAVSGDFDHKTEQIGLELKSLYKIPGIATEVNLNEVERWFNKQNVQSLQESLV